MNLGFKINGLLLGFLFWVWRLKL